MLRLENGLGHVAAGSTQQVSSTHDEAHRMHHPLTCSPTRASHPALLVSDPPPSHTHRQYDEYIASVDIRTEYVDDKSRHQRVIYKFRPFVFEGIDTIEVKGSTLMPQRVIEDIVTSCTPKNPYRVDIGLMDKVRERIEKW